MFTCLILFFLLTQQLKILLKYTSSYIFWSHFTCFATQHNRTYTSSTLPLIAIIIGIQSESKVKDCSIMILFNSKKFFLHYKNTILSFAIPNLSAPIANDSSKVTHRSFSSSMKKQYSRFEGLGAIQCIHWQGCEAESCLCHPKQIKVGMETILGLRTMDETGTMITLYCDYRTWLSYKGTMIIFIVMVK